MTLAVQDILAKADSLLMEAGGAAIGTAIVTYEPLSTAPVPTKSPYDQSRTKIYGTLRTLVAWIVVDPEDPILKAFRKELLAAGETENIDAMLYVSNLEAARKSVVLTAETKDSRITHAGIQYRLQRCKPSAHVQGIPAYYRLALARSSGAP